MTLEGIAKGLWEQMNKIAEPGADLLDIKSKTNAAAGAIRANYTPGPITGPSIIDKFQEFSKIYLEALGVKYNDGDKNKYGSYMKDILGKLNKGAYNQFITAVKNDDIDEMLNLSKDAVKLDNSSAIITPLAEKISFLSKEERINFAKTAVQAIGGNDYLKVLDDIPSYIKALNQVKSIQMAYTK